MRWEDTVRRVVPYTPGEQPQKRDVIKLNTNENPYPPAPGVTETLSAFGSEQLRLYPDPEAKVLVDALAQTYGVKPSQVFVGVGSDDVLSMAFLTFFHSDRPILFPDVTYSFYDVWAELYRIPYKKIPLTAEFRICAADYQQENGGIIFPNPNAPTGILEPLSLIEEILRANPASVVIVDEAYIDFGGESCLPLLGTYDNLLVVQTFSKSRSLAGLRIGFAIGSEALIRYLNDVKFSVNSYTMTNSACLCGAAALRDTAYFKAATEKIIATREAAKQRLREMGFTLTDSQSNFLFASHPAMPAGEIFAALKARDIYVRHWDQPRIGNFLRITIGTPEQMEALYAALADILKK